MLRSRCRSVDLQPVHCPEQTGDCVVSAYNWKTNLLCGVYKEELSSSTFYGALDCNENTNVLLGTKALRDEAEIMKKKKYSLLLKRKSFLRIRSAKCEVYLVDCKGSEGHLSNEEPPMTRPICEKTSNDFVQENSAAPGENQAYLAPLNLQTCHAKQFERNYLKSKKQFPSVGDISSLSSQDEQSKKSNLYKNLLHSNLGETGERQPTICLATAIKDSIPSPYDIQALSFKKGDKIEVTSKSENGMWKGRCKGKVGTFKFIDVKLSKLTLRKTNSSLKTGLIPRSKSVSDLMQELSLENLTPVFVLNGYDTADDIRNLSLEDLDYLGIECDEAKGILLDTIDNLTDISITATETTTTENAQDSEHSSLKSDSGFNSAEELPSCEASDAYFLPHKSFLYPISDV